MLYRSKSNLVLNDRWYYVLSDEMVDAAESQPQPLYRTKMEKYWLSFDCPFSAQVGLGHNFCMGEAIRKTGMRYDQTIFQTLKMDLIAKKWGKI